MSLLIGRPGVKGRTIWGELVPMECIPGISTQKKNHIHGVPVPMRIQRLQFYSDLKIEGNKLAAGKYGIHMIPSEKRMGVVIFNKVNDGWGSYGYDESYGSLRINVPPKGGASGMATFRL